MSNLLKTEGNTTETVVLDHGTGARLSRELVELIAHILGDTYLGTMEDSALLELPSRKLAFTTDSFVVTPIIYGNGDIGKIAVCGTVNDLAVSGAKPLYLTLSLIIEAGMLMSDLIKIIESVRETAKAADIKIVAGDTKVVGKGEADQLFINTAGIGVFENPSVSIKNVRPGQKIILSGYIGNHSIHLLSLREGLGFERNILSDCAPLNHMIRSLLNNLPAGKIASMRDVTRGGLSAVLHEHARAAGSEIRCEKQSLPIQPEAAMAANMLGVDVINLANEGCLCLFVEPDIADDALALLRAHPLGQNAAIVGEVLPTIESKVTMLEPDGTLSTIEELYGAELPRLC
ncbi:TPA: hydrogenase expression/formation protein HypE [Enterobacter cloacae]|uniref:hydrogenase expression/formation protein HypE n=1 Tax=Enterobacter cloacae complex TaxID=354276 RepID=UPI00077BDA71|nr:hydrogenase expression/formation protein HypE [Enterobacter cloacae]MCK6805401.1 hydrogenase expression/formation protein HypE [Enterobacter cloacae]MCK6826498.1 hydrogenase expression/formation protein HypE [Enterobacter cloacae]MCM7171359.1 hydrogenase expression/formation protein HypE [Enterobacter cloacae]MDT0533422.1 hydrogenase expression/formation protein HypE [Enterobacter cloacae]UPW32501.1 hydrogenase expression/formation protein HypE [Enterobacter cloacae]